MTFREMLDGVAALVARITGVPAPAVSYAQSEWRAPSDVQQGSVSVEVVSVVGVGRDELRGGYDPLLAVPGDTYTPPGPQGPQGAARLGGYVYQACGNRRLTLQVSVEVGRQDVTAHEYLEALRTSLRLPSSQAALSALGLAFQRFGASHVLPRDDGMGRALSVAVVELVLNWSHVATDAPVTTIEVVETYVQATPN